MTVLFLLSVVFYLLFPLPNRFLLLGIDAPRLAAWPGAATRSWLSVNPLLPDVSFSHPARPVVSIPVWARTDNTAHFFAEAQQPGSGPKAALDTVNQNFGVNLRHYARFNLIISALIDALGGINAAAGHERYPPGTYELNGAQALAFVRSRSDGDDFFRIRQGQLIGAFVKNPDSSNLPRFRSSSRQSWLPWIPTSPSGCGAHRFGIGARNPQRI